MSARARADAPAKADCLCVGLRWVVRCHNDTTDFMAMTQLTHVMSLCCDGEEAQQKRYTTLLTGLLHFGEFNMRECVARRRACSCSVSHG